MRFNLHLSSGVAEPVTVFSHESISAQMIGSVQASPDGVHLVAVSDRGNILVYSLPALAQSARKVSLACSTQALIARIAYSITHAE